MSTATLACRICLAVDVRLFNIAGSLQGVFEKLTSTALHTGDGRPVSACCACYAQLSKCRNLLLTSNKAENVLNAILLTHSGITIESVALVDRGAHGLCGTLTVSQTKYFDAILPAHVDVKSESDVAENEESEGFPAVDAGDVAGDSSSSDSGGPLCAAQLCDTQIHVKEEDAGGGMRDAEDAACKLQLSILRGALTMRGKPRPDGLCKRRVARGPHYCDVCQRRFTYESHLARHAKTHTGEKPFKCEVCEMAFTYKSSLLRHTKTHTGEKLFQCDVCQRRFNRNGHLETHLRTHTGERPFECSVCHHRFRQKPTLLLHLRTHTGEKPFQCHVCERRFGDKRNLLRHLKIHDIDTSN